MKDQGRRARKIGNETVSLENALECWACPSSITCLLSGGEEGGTSQTILESNIRHRVKLGSLEILKSR